MMLLTPFLMTLLSWCKKHQPKGLQMLLSPLPQAISEIASSKVLTDITAKNDVNSVQHHLSDAMPSRHHDKHCLTTRVDANLASENQLGVVL